GALLGPLLVNFMGAQRAGTRFHFVLDWQDEGLREWVRLSIPLMLGVSVVSGDPWIINRFASLDKGAVSVMTYAKQLFTAPMAVLAQAAGAASMPFFANLWAQKRHYEFATEVADSVSRVAALGLLAASGMIALAVPMIDLVMRGGRYNAADTHQTAAYFAIFSLTLFLWSAQAIYARAFYAAGNTMTPMIAGTTVTLISLPVYALLFHLHSVAGLAVASDIGITLQTLTLAVLLHKRRMVSLASLDHRELGRCLAAGAAAGLAAWAAALGVGHVLHTQTRWADAVELAAGVTVWLAAVGLLLQTLGSALPRTMMRRLGLGRMAGR
ncbi:MAG TPA: lipid II flippase MurJ, partial [Acidobacteriaceae bacterium]|nr:lipid II flippase MurJ [Acidobacteriaceae bacterium]